MIVTGNQKGFTLVEIICVLVLTGILSSTGGYLILNIVEGFVSANKSIEIADKVRMALTRLELEFQNADTGQTWNLSSAATATFTNSIGSRTITYTSGTGEVDIGGDVLIDNVTGFTMDNQTFSNVVDITLTMTINGNSHSFITGALIP